MKRVMVFGTFDLLHQGHMFFLQRARQYGDQLVAVVSRDSFVRQHKRKRPHVPQEQRIAALQQCGLANWVVSADERPGSFEVVTRWRPQVVVLGHDQHHLHEALQYWAEQQNYPLHTTFLPPRQRHLFSSSRLQTRQRWFTVLMVLAMASWASGWVAGRVLAQGSLPLPQLIWLRAVLTLPAFAVPALIRRAPFPLEKESLLGLAAAALLMLAYLTFYFMGLQEVESGRAGMLVSALNTLFVCLIASRGRWSYFTPRKQLGLASGLAGVAVLGQVWQFTGGQGWLWLSLAALLWAALTHLGQKVQQRMSSLSYLVGSYAIMVVLTTPWALPNLQLIGRLSAQGWFAVLWISLVSTGIGTGCYFLSVRVAGADRTGSFTLLVPPLAVVEGMILLAERPGWSIVPAGVLILFGLFLLLTLPRRKA